MRRVGSNMLLSMSKTPKHDYLRDVDGVTRKIPRDVTFLKTFQYQTSLCIFISFAVPEVSLCIRCFVIWESIENQQGMGQMCCCQCRKQRQICANLSDARTSSTISRRAVFSGRHLHQNILIKNVVVFQKLTTTDLTLPTWFSIFRREAPTTQQSRRIPAERHMRKLIRCRNVFRNVSSRGIFRTTPPSKSVN